MAIVTQDAFEAELTGDHIQQTDSKSRERAIARANSIAESYLRAAGYDLPIVEASASDDLKGYIIDIARYVLASMEQLLPEPADKSALYLGHQAALKWLDLVRRGEIPLDIEDQTPDDSPAPGQAAIFTNTRRRWDELL